MAELTPRINIITLGTRDMITLRTFYERLGLRASSASNENVTFFDLNGIVLALFGLDELAKDAHLASAPLPDFKGFSLAWNAISEAETDSILAHAASCGGKIVKPAEKVLWGGYSGYFADPEGNLWEVAFNPFFPFNDHMQIQLP